MVQTETGESPSRNPDEAYARGPTVTAAVIDVHAHVVFEALNGSAGLYGPEAGVDEQGAPFFRIGGYTMKPISCLLYTSPSPRDVEESRMPSSA